MANDLYIIKEIEKTIGKKLEKRSLEEIMFYGFNGYVLDGQGFVIGLNLNESEISDLFMIAQLTQLTHLSLHNNKISDVSPLQGLTALTTLYLNSNQLTDVSPLQGLTALTYLNLYSNQLTDVSPLKGLTALTRLDLDYNQLTDVSPFQGLTALTQLWLDSNQLTDVSPLQGLKQLKRLNLKHNKITQLPETIFHLDLEVTLESGSWGNGLNLYGNPLETPPVEVIKQGKAAILNYFKELTDSVRLLQCKLLIVGNGEVGKTTLMKKLLDNHFQVQEGKEDTTRGIHIEPWQLEVPFKENETEIIPQTVNLHFWDFGGQDIYHATHQFFLTKRSLYLFVWEVRREEETRSFDYWLNILKLLSDQSPVIMVMNKADKRIKYIDEAGFKSKFPNIQSFHQISCLKNQGIQELTVEICRHLSTMPHLRDKLPRVWVQIRDRLNEEKKKKNYISLTAYFSICQEFGLNEERAEFVSGYLHDLGVILHYQTDPLLQETVILNPEWATQAVYTLIDTRAIQENQGRFLFSDLHGYWDNSIYPREKHPQLIRLMEKFELCFNFTGTDLYFVPELLKPLESPVDISSFQDSGTLRFQYHYEFMPEGIVSRFIARMFYLIDDKQFWKNGVVLKFENSTALVLGESLNRRITISITGNGQRELLAIIRSHFDHIHITLNMVNTKHYDEVIPCICSSCRNSETAYLYKYHKLKLAEEKNTPHMICPESIEPALVKDMLAGVAFPKPKKDLNHTLLTVTSQLQGIAGTIQEDEDSRNGFIALLLNTHGYRVKDQTRWSRSATGKSMGEVDIKIEKNNGDALAIIEALRLSCLNTTEIKKHIDKIFNYDANGLPQNYIIVYAEVKDFNGLWESYLANLSKIQYPYPRLGDIQVGKTPFADIKLSRTRHDRHGQETQLHHLFVNMYRKEIAPIPATA